MENLITKLFNWNKPFLSPKIVITESQFKGIVENVIIVKQRQRKRQRQRLRTVSKMF